MVPMEAVEGGERVWEGEYGTKYCVYMHVNGKMRPVEISMNVGRNHKGE
jgi:hypothetical protein